MQKSLNNLIKMLSVAGSLATLQQIIEKKKFEDYEEALRVQQQTIVNNNTLIEKFKKDISSRELKDKNIADIEAYIKEELPKFLESSTFSKDRASADHDNLIQNMKGYCEAAKQHGPDSVEAGSVLDSLNFKLANSNTSISEIFANAEKFQKEAESFLDRFYTGKGPGDKLVSDWIEDINNWFAEFKGTLNQLSMSELTSFFHLFISAFIFSCVLSLILIYSGDLLIRYFNLETKYPRIAKYIRLRRKFQNFYFWVNCLFIVLALLTIIYVNLLNLKLI